MPYWNTTPITHTSARCMTFSMRATAYQSCSLLDPVKADAAVTSQICELAQDVGSMQVDQHG